jgi:hypothetical protein
VGRRRSPIQFGLALAPAFARCLSRRYGNVTKDSRHYMGNGALAFVAGAPSSHCKHACAEYNLHMAPKSEIQELSEFIRDHMITKSDIADFATKDDVRMIVREELRDVRTDLKSIRTDLDELKEKVDNITGYRKEIDHALERIAKIEKHLGINNKIAA